MTHAWMPTSPCGPDCLTSDEPTVGRIRATGRVVRAVGVLLGAMAVAPILPMIGRRGRERVVRWFFRAVLRAFGVRLAVFDEERLRAFRGGALVVNNHISWLDIVAINAVRPMRAQAKSEVRGWPVIGWLARVAGTVYVDRERLRRLPAAVAELAGVLRSGSLVTVTPEGTSWCGMASGPFRRAPFQAAIDGDVPVIPVALRFLADGRETTAPAFIGDETLLDSLGRVARLRGLVLEMHVLEALPAGRTTSRRELAALSEAAIVSALGLDKPVPTQRRRRRTVKSEIRAPIAHPR